MSVRLDPRAVSVEEASALAEEAFVVGLPTGVHRFEVALRLYSPKPDVAQGSRQPPPIERVD